MGAAARSRRVEEACGTLEAALMSLQEPQGRDSGGSAEQLMRADTERAALGQAAEVLRQAVAKCAFMAASADDPAVSALLDALQQKALHLFVVFAALQAGRGACLRAEVQACASRTVHAVLAFVRSAFAKRASAADVNRAAGIVFERCCAAAKLPVDNRAATSSRLLKVLAGLRDAGREVDELLATEAAPDRGSDAGSSDNGLEEQDVVFEAEALLPKEVEVGRQVQRITAAVSRQIRALASRLVRLPPDLGAQTSAWDAAISPLKELATAMNDLVAGTYHPQDPQELQECCDSVQKHWQLLEQALGREAGGEADEEVASAASALATAVSALKAAVPAG